ncbi:hypothetical protein SAMN05443246_2381 [Paenibacillus sp. GP183]|nr:hypothetical protein SAMN05443246_2381 [Paenibacillus sp. GP183]
MFVVTIIVQLICFNDQTVHAFDGAEVFDIQKGEVIKIIKNSANLQSEVEKWLSSIAGTVGSLKMEPDSGIGLKIELVPPLKVENQWITGTVTEVALFISEKETYYPTLLIFTKENSVIAVNIQYDLMMFLKKNKLFKPEFNLNNPPKDK